MLNQQEPEAYSDTSGVLLDVIEIFHTLQGEGPFSGQGAVFVRLAGCNLKCPLCDTQYTEGRHDMTASEIIKAIDSARDGKVCHLVVITGGEPFRQNIVPLVTRLLEHYAEFVQIETNGVLGIPRDLIDQEGLVVVVSPKTSKIHESTCHANAFKYVLSHDDIDTDGLPLHALGHTARPRVARPPEGFDGPVYVNPCDDKDLERNFLNTNAARDSALRHGHIFGVQLHKLVNLP